MDILLHQKSVLGNISDELNYSRKEKIIPGKKVFGNALVDYFAFAA